MNQSINKEEMEVLNSMIEAFKKSEAIYHPSLFWEHLNKLIIAQLQESGYQNFKRAINRNLLGISNKQRGSILLKWLRAPNLKILTAKFDAGENTEFFMPKNHNKIVVFLYKYYMMFLYKSYYAMLWEYTNKYDELNLLDNIEEPLEGNPLRIYYKWKLISEPVCTSVLEFYSIINHISPEEKENLTIAELGGVWEVCVRVFESHKMQVCSL